MPYVLSPQTEQFIASMVAGGVYPSKEAAIEAAVEALREKRETASAVPGEHVELVEQAIISADSGRLRPLATEDWSRLRQIAHDAAGGNA